MLSILYTLLSFKLSSNKSFTYYSHFPDKTHKAEKGYVTYRSGRTLVLIHMCDCPPSPFCSVHLPYPYFLIFLLDLT